MAELYKKKIIKIIKTVIGATVFLSLLVWYIIAAYFHVNYHTSYDFRPGQSIRYIAHRGLSSEYYQNTYDAFYWAGQSDFFAGIECDIWKTKDGIWVCCHDDTPFADRTIKVSESKFEDIEKLPLYTDNKGEFVILKEDIRITTLEQYLEILEQCSKIAVIEIKCEYSENDIGKLIDFIKEKADIKKMIFGSFKFKVIERILSIQKDAVVMLFTNNKVNSYLYGKMGYNIGFNKKLLEKYPKRINLLHENNSFVNVYTVNTMLEAQKFIEMGVDYITTDYDLNKLKER